jgi:glutamate synthase (NADPH/NADH) small chain
MGKPTGFIEFSRTKPPARRVAERVGDYRHVYTAYPADELTRQAARCMDCGIPFCHQGCPLGNLIPDWNDLVYRNSWRAAITRLHQTNNFPEFTGLLCPAPCEGSCVLGINAEAVTIKSIELAIVDRAFDEGWIVPEPPPARTWQKVAVVGSGPAGLAAAAELNRAGHSVTVFDKSDRIGGLLRYGIPEFKLEKRVLDRRLALLAAEGVVFRPGVHVGVDVSAADVRRDFDAVLLAGGAGRPRDLDVPGRSLDGIHFAVPFLTAQNRRCEGDDRPAEATLSAAGRHVVIIGGGDTGADCLGTVHRQGARSVSQLELLPQPPAARADDNPWPLWPNVFRTSSAHEEGGDRHYSVETTALVGDEAGRVHALRARRVERVVRDGRATVEPVPGSEFEMSADLVLLAMGFTGPDRDALLAGLEVRLTERGTVWRDDRWMTSVPGVFTAGDMQRGQSLIVWAIDDGRRAAAAVDEYLRTAR